VFHAGRREPGEVDLEPALEAGPEQQRGRGAGISGTPYAPELLLRAEVADQALLRLVRPGIQLLQAKPVRDEQLP
jgi:hypothetical protein